MIDNCIFLRSAILLALITIAELRCVSQEPCEPYPGMMFYNVENLFDTLDDSLKNDDDFLPSGVLRWNATRYHKKINSVYKTIVAAGEWEPPAIIAMCEVENRKVLNDLVYDTFLMKYGYRIIHEESPDERGIDVCMIYRSDRVKLDKYEYWLPSVDPAVPFTSRSILYSRFIIRSDTFHLITCHWPSRRGGTLAAQDSRMNIAEMIKDRIDSLNRSRIMKCRIIVAGDFNCTPDDNEIQIISETPGMFNLSAEPARQGKGSYRYMGTWEMIDQVIISENLANDVSLRVFSPGFLLAGDPKYPGQSPFSTYRGYRYQGGYSDHLPLLLDLCFRPSR